MRQNFRAAEGTRGGITSNEMREGSRSCVQGVAYASSGGVMVGPVSGCALWRGVKGDRGEESGAHSGARVAESGGKGCVRHTRIVLMIVEWTAVWVR